MELSSASENNWKENAEKYFDIYLKTHLGKMSSSMFCADGAGSKEKSVCENKSQKREEVIFSNSRTSGSGEKTVWTMAYTNETIKSDRE